MKINIYFWLFLLFFICIESEDVLSQARITVYYDSTWAINSREQASYYRNTFIDTTYIALIGPVYDHYADGKIAMEGKYVGGLKQGEFSFYYPNGQLKVKGEFAKNYPVGIWEYFYEDGQPWQKIDFMGDDFRVISYTDQSGVQKVTQGNGRYEGIIYGFDQLDTLFVDGLVEDSLKEGIWVYYDEDGGVIYEEKYKMGDFRYRLIYNGKGLLLTKSKKPVNYTMLLPFELLHTERFVYAPDINKSDYHYFDFLPDADTVYYDEFWEECDSLSASYYRPTNVNNKKETSGYIRDYYMLGQLQMEGRFFKGNKTGPFRYYHENGQLASEGSYQDNQKTGFWYYYYPDGTNQRLIFYEDGQRYIDKYWSSSGELVLEEGYGQYEEEIQEADNTFRVVGKFKDYQKHGTWKGYRMDGQLYFEEGYDNGQLISGVSYDLSGNSYEYVQSKVMAQPSRGMQNFYSFISNKLVYPIEARKLNIEGKVFTQLVVNKNGDLISLETIKSPHRSLSLEARKAILEYGKWEPAKVRGQLAKMKLILPITFSLQNL